MSAGNLLYTCNFNITSITNQKYALRVQKYIAIEAVLMTLYHKVIGIRFLTHCVVDYFLHQGQRLRKFYENPSINIHGDRK